MICDSGFFLEINQSVRTIIRRGRWFNLLRAAGTSSSGYGGSRARNLLWLPSVVTGDMRSVYAGCPLIFRDPAEPEMDFSTGTVSCQIPSRHPGFLKPAARDCELRTRIQLRIRSHRINKL